MLSRKYAMLQGGTTVGVDQRVYLFALCAHRALCRGAVKIIRQICRVKHGTDWYSAAGLHCGKYSGNFGGIAFIILHGFYCVLRCFSAYHGSRQNQNVFPLQ